MLPSIFEKHKICLNRPKSLLLVQDYQQKFRILRRNSVLSFDFTFLSTMLQASIHIIFIEKKIFFKEITCAHLELKSIATAKTFSAVCILLVQLASIIFIPCDNWKAMFFIKVYRYPEVFFNRNVLVLFETSDLK